MFFDSVSKLISRMKPNARALTVAVFALSVGPSSSQVYPEASQVIDDPEAYAVYAAVLPTALSTRDKPLTVLTLLQKTRAGMDCIGPEKDKKLQPGWRPVVENYRKENARVRLIQSGRSLDVEYSVVTLAQLRTLMQNTGYSRRSPRSNAPGADVFARFPGGRLVALSAVGFNSEKTRAMVAMQYDCFPSLEPRSDSAAVCYEGKHITLEKQAGRWRVVAPNVLGCFWVA